MEADSIDNKLDKLMTLMKKIWVHINAAPVGVRRNPEEDPEETCLDVMDGPALTIEQFDEYDRRAKCDKSFRTELVSE